MVAKGGLANWGVQFGGIGSGNAMSIKHRTSRIMSSRHLHDLRVSRQFSHALIQFSQVNRERWYLLVQSGRIVRTLGPCSRVSSSVAAGLIPVPSMLKLVVFDDQLPENNQKTCRSLTSGTHTTVASHSVTPEPARHHRTPSRCTPRRLSLIGLRA